MTEINLISVYTTSQALDILYELLQERQPFESISHKHMPSKIEHAGFVQKRPYTAWYLIQANGQFVGATYLSKQNEIGIGILNKYRGKGYAKNAIEEIMRFHPGPYLSNINPENKKSIKLFESLGFAHLQNTYLLDKA